MQNVTQAVELSPEMLAQEFFQDSAGDWHSQRRYYTLSNGEAQEVVSLIHVRYIEPGAPELIQLAKMHHLDNLEVFICGSEVTWESSYTGTERKPSKGSTLFGVLGNELYRDRGFATPKPIKAQYYFSQPKTMCLRSEYKGSVFEEELKLIGELYRTRQTIISRAGQEQMIGQYLEKRI
ncbi:phycobiliprotein lyase [Spirulina subsalsa]|uniref:phycobiliprotein lyase n=1 Tax=Spirulina subsalsa TaxID=54311 RepID=UPI0003094382|nr:phycobiliprotein lyase [Spirulina subsalsa]